MELNAWKDLLKHSTSVDLKQLKPFNRQIRRAISELRREGIIYVPVGKYVYKRMEKGEEMEVFVRRETKHLATQYFNSVQPLTRFIKDDRQRKIYGDLFKIMEELQ